MAAHARDAASHARDAVGHARDAAGGRIYVAREWAAPRLDAAAHSVEDQIAPKVSAMLSQAASKIDPAPRARSRRWPMVLFLTGVAIGAVGFAMYRKNAEQWTEAMKETAADASRWMGEKTHTGASKVSETTENVASKVSSTADELGSKAETQAEQAAKKSS
ncbi:hypothetical protein [Streptosporangium sp. NPDC000396]|uniref:hypothetical protein n=1 Tax=Streptosporangium sp. NPDC000396 TaxID=3366185 RepID=UPI0036C70A5C